MKQQGIERVAVIGAGLMGFGIAVEYARFGYQVNMFNTREESSRNALKQAREALDLMAETELITRKEADAAYRRLYPTTNIEVAVKNADFICESVSENLTLKREIFSKLDKICPSTTILATNTSGLRVTDITADAKLHPERIVATHYYQPAHFVPLVEVMPGEKTAQETVEKAALILRGMHKRVIVMKKEYPGYIGNRIQSALGREIISLVDQGIATPEMIDEAVSFGFGRRMTYTGYFKRMDLIGLDFGYNSAKERGRQIWQPIAEHVERGELGMKTGKGFYDWPGDSAMELHRWQNTELIRMIKHDIEKGLI
jgi:3-hydroxybutyryl-CoA dehydrogenase